MYVTFFFFHFEVLKIQWTSFIFLIFRQVMFVLGQKANAETCAGGNCSVLESLKERM